MESIFLYCISNILNTVVHDKTSVISRMVNEQKNSVNLGKGPNNRLGRGDTAMPAQGGAKKKGECCKGG